MNLKIKEHRQKKGVSQIKLGELIEVSEVTIQKYENGSIKPPLDKIEKISIALDVSEIELLGLDYKSNDKLYNLLSPKDKKHFKVLKQHYELMDQFKNNCFFCEEDMEKKLLSVGIENSKNIMSTENLVIINGLLLMVNTLRDYLEDDEIKEESYNYKTFKSMLKSFKYFNANAEVINDKI